MPNVIDEPFFDADGIREICPACEVRFATGSAIGTRGIGRRATLANFLHCNNSACIKIANGSAGLKPLRKITPREIHGFTLAVLLRYQRITSMPPAKLHFVLAGGFTSLSLTKIKNMM